MRSLRDREVATDRPPGLEFRILCLEGCHLIHLTNCQEVLLAQFSLHVHKGGPKPYLFNLPHNVVGIFRALLAPAVTVGETEGAMDSTSVFFWPLLLPITL